MRLIDPSIEVIFHTPDVSDPLNLELGESPRREERFLERVGRTCYKSEDKITGTSAGKFVEMLVRRGHHAMLEHCVASAHLVCNRGVTHELVRHRLASYAQESTRYCDYAKSKHGNEVTFIIPPDLGWPMSDEWAIWKNAMEYAEDRYLMLRDNGVPPQIARGVLPIDVKTEIWITANLREWMHIFRLRCASTAHPHIRRLILRALALFADRIPSMFADLAEEFMGDNLRKDS